jgi:hypothetical protein
MVQVFEIGKRKKEKGTKGINVNQPPALKIK